MCTRSYSASHLRHIAFKTAMFLTERTPHMMRLAFQQRVRCRWAGSVLKRFEFRVLRKFEHYFFHTRFVNLCKSLYGLGPVKQLCLQCVSANTMHASRNESSKSVTCAEQLARSKSSRVEDQFVEVKSNFTYFKTRCDHAYRILVRLSSMIHSA